MEDSNIELLQFSRSSYLIGEAHIFIRDLVPNVSYEAWKKEILPLFKQQKKQVLDLSGNRWIQCEICGQINTSQEFVSYGGKNHLNLGKCRKCMRH